MSVPVVLVLGGGPAVASTSGSATFQAEIKTLADLDAAISGVVTGDWLISESITLDADKTLPANVTLHFRNNAKITFGTFNFIGTNTRLENNLEQIFIYTQTALWSDIISYNIGDEVLNKGYHWESLTAANLNNEPIEGANWTRIENPNGKLTGDWHVNAFFPEWWGAVGDRSTDDSDAIQNMFDSVSLVNPQKCVFPPYSYAITRDIALPNITDTTLSHLEISGFGCEIITTAANIEMFRRVPKNAGESFNWVSSSINIKGITFRGNRTQDGLFLGANYLAVIEKCRFFALNKGAVLAFALQTAIDSCEFKGMADEGLRIDTGQGYWDGATRTTSQSNSTRVTSCRWFMDAAANASCHIIACSNVQIVNPVFEGNNPVYNIQFEQLATTVKEFYCYNAHFENTPTGANAYMGIPADGHYIFDGIVSFYPATMIKFDAGATAVVRCTVKNATNLNAGAQFEGVGVNWFFQGPELSTIVKDTARWVGGVVALAAAWHDGGSAMATSTADITPTFIGSSGTNISIGSSMLLNAGANIEVKPTAGFRFKVDGVRQSTRLFAATTLGNVAGYIEMTNSGGTLYYIPVYDSIT